MKRLDQDSMRGIRGGRGIEKTDIRRGVVISAPHIPDHAARIRELAHSGRVKFKAGADLANKVN